MPDFSIENWRDEWDGLPVGEREMLQDRLDSTGEYLLTSGRGISAHEYNEGVLKGESVDAGWSTRLLLKHLNMIWVGGGPEISDARYGIDYGDVLIEARDGV